MDASWLILVSVFALAFVPVWTRGWRKLVMQGRRPTIMRVCTVVILSLVTLLIFQIGPWILLGAIYGTLKDMHVGNNIPLGIAIMFGPSIVMQAGYAIYDAIWGA